MLNALRPLVLTFLMHFRYVLLMQAELRRRAMHCERCHGFGKLAIPGGTITCPLCRFARDLAKGKY